ncbi:MAG TPA: hypothetical protein VL443_11350 [Cyclobacteriaceae bacterium]|jgi:hypothetical protein|nr:hypothetical protein [Cyclobacteriaceae bacterium]
MTHRSNFFNRAKESLFWKISILFFLILILLGISYTLITISLAKRYSDETTQKLNANVAAQMLLEVNPFADGKVNKAALGKIMHSMMAVNPTLEVYLLDPYGKILSFVVFDKKVMTSDLKVLKFLWHKTIEVINPKMNIFKTKS